MHKDPNDLLVKIVGDKLHVYYQKIIIPNCPVFVTEKTGDGLLNIKIFSESFGYEDVMTTPETREWMLKIMRELDDDLSENL